MAVSYEWDVEEAAAADTAEHEEGEVLEHWHQKSWCGTVALSVSIGLSRLERRVSP